MSGKSSHFSEYRRGLVDWMCEQAEWHLKMSNRTAHIAVAILDLFISTPEVFAKTRKQDLEPVGLTCLLIASKFEETLTP